MRHPGLRECLYLVRNGVPFDVAFSLSDVDRTAWSIMFGEMDGGKFNVSTMRWEERK